MGNGILFKFMDSNLVIGQQSLKMFMNKTIQEKNKGYICFPDAYNWCMAIRDAEHKKYLMESILNFCDSSLIKKLISDHCGLPLVTYPGPIAFSDTIANSNLRQCLIGPEENEFQKLERITGNSMNHVFSFPLPLINPATYDYGPLNEFLAKNKIKVAWVLLGAGKQEKFCYHASKLKCNSIFMAVGAALKYYTGELQYSKKSLMGLSPTWLIRIYKEPKKTIKRHMVVLKELHNLKNAIKNGITLKNLAEYE